MKTLCYLFASLLLIIVFNNGCSKSASKPTTPTVNDPLIGTWIYDTSDTTNRLVYYFNFTPQGTYELSTSAYLKNGTAWQVYKQIKLTGDFTLLGECFVKLFNNSQTTVYHGSTITEPEFDGIMKYAILGDTLFDIENIKCSSGFICGVYQGSGLTLPGSWQETMVYCDHNMSFSSPANNKGLITFNDDGRILYYFNYDSIFAAIDTGSYVPNDTLPFHGIPYKYRYTIKNNTLYVCTYDSSFHHESFGIRQ